MIMQDLVITFREDGGHLYEQIYRHIREEIRKGKLLCQEKLPSTRFLAEYLQVSRSTVELAYEQLVAEGYLENVPYKGYYVARVEELYQIGEASEKPEAAVENKPVYRVDFSPNAIDMDCFPFNVWRRITKNILSQDKKETFALGEAKGDLQLRETIARYLHASRGVNAEASRIIVGAGNDYLLMLLNHVLGGGRAVAFENPTYPRAYRIFGLFAEKLLTVPSDESGIRVDMLARTDADAVYVMPAHQYPTGVSMPIGRRHALLRWAQEKEGRYVIEDDYDSEFRYRGKPIPSLQASDTAGRVIYIGSFSKAIAPAIRVSFMVLPPKLAERYERRCSVFSSTVSRIDQTVLNDFIREGAFERHLNRMRKVYKEKQEVLLEEIKPLLQDFVLSGENAGLHVLLTDRRGRSERMLREAAEAVGVRVYGISEAFVEKEKHQTGSAATLLIGFGGLTKAQIREGAALLQKAWEA